MMHETCEVVIRVKGNSGRRKRNDASQDLESALKSLRKNGYEVDLYIRGTWIRAGAYQRPQRIPETLLQKWSLRQGDLQCHNSSVIPGTEILPCRSRKPWPEIVLRGVKTTCAG